MSKKMIIRIQSSDGTKRIEAETTWTTKYFFEKVKDIFNLPLSCFNLYKDRSQKEKLSFSSSKSLSAIKLRHGDMLYLVVSKSPERDDASPGPQQPVYVVEDLVDKILQKQDGRMKRPRDDRLCRHGVNALCIHCTSLEPYDPTYLKDQNIKHMSFHAYMKKLTGGVDRGKFVALENISCTIKSGCTEHPPWPDGICTKCQPNAVTLSRQTYRHVDNIMFENPSIVERFLDYWRTTGHQRIGLLYGSYDVHKDVPLGIKATVAAIYEPPQEGGRDYVRLLPDEKADRVDKIAHQLGLCKVGWMFTDLVADDRQKGTVKHLRNVDSHFLSAQECMMAGHFQNQHPNPCKMAPSGYFGSKFTTVLITGDKNNQVHMEGYQVSNQCMALVRDKCLVPTKDVPELAYIKESSNKQYVPDVFYKEKDSYGNEVMQLGRPLPVEYLLLDVPASTPVEPQYTFNSYEAAQKFPVENRFIDAHVQDFSVLNDYLNQFPSDKFLEAATDFHFLLYIATMDILPLFDSLGPLLQAVKDRNSDPANKWSEEEQWSTVKQLLVAQGGSPPASRQSSTRDVAMDASSSSSSSWMCEHCTFINTPDKSTCEMCALPRN